ncbi:hypothetical protein [Microbacterium paulum]
MWGYDYFGGTRTVDVHVRRICAPNSATSSAACATWLPLQRVDDQVPAPADCARRVRRTPGVRG